MTKYWFPILLEIKAPEVFLRWQHHSSFVCFLSSHPSTTCLLELAGAACTTPRAALIPPTRCWEVVQTLSLLFPGKPLISDFKHCQSYISLCCSLLPLKKDLCLVNCSAHTPFCTHQSCLTSPFPPAQEFLFVSYHLQCACIMKL